MNNFNNILIMGYGKSGQAVESFLINKKIKSFHIYDEKFKNNGYFVNKLTKKFVKKFDTIVLSPGISIYNKYVQFAIKNNIKVISELEFGFSFLSKKTKLIAVTGTNGKTTTTALLSECIKASGKSCEAVGNIGSPLTNYCDKEYDYLVCEVSSFQLEAIEKFNPDIAIILNIAEDHTDRHKTFENYINSKFNLLKNFPKLCILNGDDAILKNRTKTLNLKKKYFSITQNNTDIYINQNDEIMLCKDEIESKVCDVENIKLLPIFIPNILAIFLVLDELKIDKTILLKEIEIFDKMSHKCEIVTTNNNILFVNDSKATNIHATINALSMCKKPTLLLLGGTDKKLNFDMFFNDFSTYNLKKIICFGEAKNRILKSAKKHNFKDIVKVPHLKEAVEMAVKMANENDIVLFSPACSSFDEFSGYKERGEYFKKLVFGCLDGQAHGEK